MVLFCIAWHGFSIECHCCPLQTRKANKSHTHCTTLETKLHRFKVSVSVSMKHIESWHRKIPQWQQALGPWPQKKHFSHQTTTQCRFWIVNCSHFTWDWKKTWGQVLLLTLLPHLCLFAKMLSITLQSSNDTWKRNKLCPKPLLSWVQVLSHS